MKTILILSITATVFVSGQCWSFFRPQHNHTKEEITSNCADFDVDAYLDKVIGKTRAVLPDPMRLPPKSTYSNIELRDGVLWGLSELERFGKAEVHCQEKKISISVKLTTEQLKGRYTWRKERNEKDPWEGYVVFISNDFEADAVLAIEKVDDEESHASLEKFQIQRFKDAKIEITGMGLLTWVIGEMTTLMSGIFHRAIAHAVESPLEEALVRMMKEITIE